MAETPEELPEERPGVSDLLQHNKPVEAGFISAFSPVFLLKNAGF